MRNERTNYDFSRHEVRIIMDADGVSIYEFKRPDSYNGSLKFINTQGVMTVTGDFGNWVFCREFRPCKDAKVSGGYWDEKLEMYSKQKSHEYSPEATKKAIEKFKENFEDYYSREMNEDELEWVENLENSAEDYYEYIYTAYRETPSSLDYEDVPFEEERHFWLNCVYDGFELMCEKL